MRFYADENFPLPVVAELRRLGHDVVTAFEDGRANRGIDDEAVLKRATTLDHIVLTINRVDFLRLHNSGYEHAGLVLCTVDIDFSRQANKIHRLCTSIETLVGQVVRVNRPG
jgi:Domain of unknown function (DUF5615)